MSLKFILAVIFIFSCFTINPEIIIKKDGEKITGEIIKIKTTYLTLKSENNKKIYIDKKDIEKIYYNENEYNLDKKLLENPEYKNKSEEIKNKITFCTGLYKKYKENRNASFVFLIIGASLTTLPLTLATAPIIYYCTDYILYLPLITTYGLFITAGLIFLTVSAVYGVISANEYKAWQKAAEIPVELSFGKKSGSLSFKYKF
jgi:hypothetical protein